MNRSLVLAGLVAGLALTVAGPARAGIAFNILDTASKDGIKIYEDGNGVFHVTAPDGGTANFSNLNIVTENSSQIQGSVTIDGNDIKFDATSNKTTGSNFGYVQLAMQVTNTNTSGPGTTLNFYASDGAYSGPTTGKAALVETVSTFSGSSPTSTVYGVGGLKGVSQHFPTPQTSVLTGPNQTASATSGSIPLSQLTQYYVSNVGGSSHIGTGNKLGFVSRAALATPEPTGVLLGVLGLPCMAGLLVWARRRRVPVAA